MQNGFATAPTTQITNTYAVDRNYRVGYVQTWSFSIQQSLPHNLTLEASLPGHEGHAAGCPDFAEHDTPGLAAAIASSGFSIANAGLFTFDTSDGNSIYHSLVTRFNRRFAKGISLSTTYTFSKSIDNASNIGGGGSTVAQILPEPARRARAFQLRPAPQLQQFLHSDSPVGDTGLLRGIGLGRAAAEGLDTERRRHGSLGHAVHSARAGQPGERGRHRHGRQRPRAGHGLADRDRLGFFNPLAFTLPVAGTLGDAARNTIPGIPRFAHQPLFRTLVPHRRQAAGGIPRGQHEFPEPRELHRRGHAWSTPPITGCATATASMRTITAQLRFRF